MSVDLVRIKEKLNFHLESMHILYIKNNTIFNKFLLQQQQQHFVCVKEKKRPALHHTKEVFSCKKCKCMCPLYTVGKIYIFVFLHHKNTHIYMKPLRKSPKKIFLLLRKRKKAFLPAFFLALGYTGNVF